MACTAEQVEIMGVQEMLEREQLLAVPPAFIRPLHDRPLLSSLHLDDQLPIIDVSGLLSPLTRPQVLQDISLACTHWGFFQAVNHGVRDEVVAEMRAACVRFFNQPAKERNKVTSVLSPRIDFSHGSRKEFVIGHSANPSTTSFEHFPLWKRGPFLVYMIGLL